jgi:hypothetical protein
VAVAVSSLQNAFGLPVFGTAAAEFTPLGDPDGLLIVVRQGRPWFPTTTVTPSLGLYCCHRRAAKRREVAGAGRELPSQGCLAGFVGVSVSIPLAARHRPVGGGRLARGLVVEEPLCCGEVPDAKLGGCCLDFGGAYGAAGFDDACDPSCRGVVEVVMER